MAAEIRITAEPVDNNRCKFVVSEPLFSGGVRRFTDATEAKGSPLAEAIFAIPELAASELIVSGNIVTVVKQTPAPWQAVGRLVGAVIRSTLATGAPAVAAAPPTRPAGGEVDDDALYEQVAKLFDEQVNPMVARHGGHVELIDVQDAVVMLRMGGGCQGCGMADVTLRQGIEGMLARFIHAVRGIVDITDHATGANPYFQASKK